MDKAPELQSEILGLKKELGAVILAHNYQLTEIQDVADYVGDSLGLARQAAVMKADLMVVCGVFFMAETAAILNPGKVVLIPDLNAGCPLANFASAEMVREWRKQYPDHTFVAYVNTTAEVKAEVDICCTSSNAVSIVKKLDNDKIVFLPDKNLGSYVQKKVPEKKIVLWPGFCVVHENADIGSVVRAKAQHPDALMMVHPECRTELLDMADGILSTGQMFDFVAKHTDTKKFLVVTEWGITHALRKHFPDKIFIEPYERMECRNMKRITLEKLAVSLKEKVYQVSVDPVIADRARGSIERMLGACM